MLPAETQRLIEKHGIKYVLAQFVDIHGSAKTKSVPISGLPMVAEAGAGFAGFAISGMGMEPHGPDFMAKGDLSTLTPVPWQPGYGRIVCIGHVNGEPWPYDSRYVLQQQVERLKVKGWTLNTGLEPEFNLMRRDANGKLQLVDASDNLDKPCYDYKGLSRSREFLEKLTEELGELREALATAGDPDSITGRPASGAAALAAADVIFHLQVSKKPLNLPRFQR